jgi:hypothetical protein
VVDACIGREDPVPLGQNIVVTVLVQVLAEPVGGDQVLDGCAIDEALELGVALGVLDVLGVLCYVSTVGLMLPK